VGGVIADWISVEAAWELLVARMKHLIKNLLPLTIPLLAGAGEVPASQPATTRESTTQPAAARGSTVLEPVKEGTTQPAAVPAAQFADGVLLTDLAGQLRHEKNGEAVFEFEYGRKRLRMGVLPNTILARMEAASSSDASVRFRVTGRTTSYRGHNHIWIQDAVVIPDGPQ
jgi:hypothetical protein